MSTPLPITEGTNNLWTSLPDPPAWTVMTTDTINLPPQSHCAVNRDGKVFLFGTTIGFAVFDIASERWSANPPTFQSGLSMANLLNPYGINSAVFPDQYTIAIFSSTPPTYMELDSRTLTISGVAEPGFTSNLHGFCMDVIPTNPPVPVVCGGSIQPPVGALFYSGDCWQFGLNASITSNPFATMPSGQDGCSLLASGSQFIVFPGYLSTYHPTPPPVSAANPDMYLYDMTTNVWSTVPNIQDKSYIPLAPYASAATMPGTDTAVLYGGLNPISGLMYGLIGIFDLQGNQWVQEVNRPANLSSPPPLDTPGSSGGSSGGGKSNIGAIAGGTAGGVVALVALAAFVLHKRKRSLQDHARNPYSPSKTELETLNEASSSCYNCQVLHAGNRLY